MSIRSRRTRNRQPRNTRLCAIVFVAASLGLVGSFRGASAFAGEGAEFRVIVDPQSANTFASREQLAEAFLKTTTRWPDGEPIRPVDQRSDSAIRRAFSEGILKRTVAAIRSYWQQRIFSGRDVPPPELDSDDAVVRYVSEHRGAVGYVSASTRTGETKVVTVK
jgi:ABC-type phosphate transport system substrate-binding protein